MSIPKDARIYVAGHRGLVGNAIMNALQEQDYVHLITRTKQELDLTKQEDVLRFFEEEKPE
jgi:GDP-L-fucose synthase